MDMKEFERKISATRIKKKSRSYFIAMDFLTGDAHYTKSELASIYNVSWSCVNRAINRVVKAGEKPAPKAPRDWVTTISTTPFEDVSKLRKIEKKAFAKLYNHCEVKS